MVIMCYKNMNGMDVLDYVKIMKKYGTCFNCGKILYFHVRTVKLYENPYFFKENFKFCSVKCKREFISKLTSNGKYRKELIRNWRKK